MNTERDLMIRLFVEYCSTLCDTYDRAVEATRAYEKHTLRVQKYDTIPQRHKPHIFENESIRLAYERDILWKRYREHCRYIHAFVPWLSRLSTCDLDILYLRYELRLTYRQMGDIMSYSHMQVMRIVETILDKM